MRTIKSTGVISETRVPRWKSFEELKDLELDVFVQMKDVEEVFPQKEKSLAGSNPERLEIFAPPEKTTDHLCTVCVVQFNLDDSNRVGSIQIYTRIH